MPSTSFADDTADGIVIADGFQNLNNSWSVGASGALMSVATGITAHAGGTQAAGFQLTARANNVTTVGSAADSVLLPLAVAGMVVYVVNSAATNAMTVYGAGTDTINAVATATGVSQAAGKSAVYFCTASAPAGAWWRILSA